MITIADLCETLTGLPNVPSKEQEKYLQLLIDNILAPIEATGTTLKINSGYRSPAVNKAVKGAKNSEHLVLGTGAAADITTGSVKTNKALFDKIIAMQLPYRQIIDEKKYRWIHISYNPNDVKRQVLHL